MTRAFALLATLALAGCMGTGAPGTGTPGTANSTAKACGAMEASYIGMLSEIEDAEKLARVTVIRDAATAAYCSPPLPGNAHWVALQTGLMIRGATK